MHIADKYKIIKELGDQKKRKFGRVFLICRRDNEHQLAILKTIKKTGYNEQLCERLRNEATFDFDHPGLPSVIDFSESESEIMLILEYKTGITLDSFWKSIKKQERINKLKTITSALIPLFEYINENKIVHCDIKPSNILIDQKANGIEIHLIDFGLALDLNNKADRKLIFPLGFAAPELILNKVDCIDHTTDIFALGITYWRLFSGKLPLTHPNPSIFTNLQLVHPLPENQQINSELQLILNKMCIKHPFKTSPNRMNHIEVSQALKENNQRRYKNLREVYSDLEKITNSSSWINRVLFGILRQN